MNQTVIKEVKQMIKEAKIIRHKLNELSDRTQDLIMVHLHSLDLLNMDSADHIESAINAARSSEIDFPDYIEALENLLKSEGAS